MSAENILPYNDDRSKGEQVQEMFDNIAPAYDFMNRAMTFGIDRLWRRHLIAGVCDFLRKTPNKSPKLLDVATGTADVAIDIAKAYRNVAITGVDLSMGMINLGKEKIDKEGLSQRVVLKQADCLDLPFEDNTFDCITVAYGVRNFSNLKKGYSEMRRVLRPGGMLCVLELATPKSKIIRPFYNLYTRYVIPAMGRIFSKDTRAYSYLPESVAAVAQAQEMCQLMREAGLVDPTYHREFPEVCIIYKGYK